LTSLPNEFGKLIVVKTKDFQAFKRANGWWKLCMREIEMPETKELRQLHNSRRTNGKVLQSRQVAKLIWKGNQFGTADMELLKTSQAPKHWRQMLKHFRT